MIIDLPDHLIDALVQTIADRLAPRLEQLADQQQSPWMTVDEAIAYSRVPDGTFRKLVQTGEIRHHGGRTHRFHRMELDTDLGYVADGMPALRSVG